MATVYTNYRRTPSCMPFYKYRQMTEVTMQGPEHSRNIKKESS
jgi:hypothetical protein